MKAKGVFLRLSAGLIVVVNPMPRSWCTNVVMSEDYMLLGILKREKGLPLFTIRDRLFYY